MAARDVVRSHLDRLAVVNPVLNAAVAGRSEAAMREASRVQQLVDAGVDLPLAGVPFSVKDVIATADLPTTCGSVAFGDNQPTIDAVAVQRLRAAGAIVIAKSNCPEFAFGVTTDNTLHGVTRNPWGAASPGGSSGGEAALVASGATAFGIGTDYGGSLRWPAQSTGVLALRPTVGRVPGGGQLPDVAGTMDGTGAWNDPSSVQQAFQVIGPLCHTVADLALIIGVMSGDRSLIDLGRTGEFGRSRLRVAWTAAEDIAPLTDAVVAGLHGAVEAFAGCGASMAEQPQVLAGLLDTFNGLRGTDRLDALRAAVVGRADRLQASTQELLAYVAQGDPTPWWDRLRALRRRVLHDFEGFDVLMLPVAPTSVCTIEGTAMVGEQEFAGFELMAQCRAVSALGFPALSIPVTEADGYPVSVQIIGRPGEERLVLSAAAVLEDALGGQRTPPWLTPHTSPMPRLNGVA